MTDERRVEVASEAPKWADLYGADPNFTLGMDASRYLAHTRGECPDDLRCALCLLGDAADEVERLRGDRDALREQVRRLRASRESNRGGWERTMAERDALRAAVDRVRALGERDGRDLLAAWLASNGVEQPDTVAVEAAAFVLAALESGNYGTPEWFSSIDKPLFPLSEGEQQRSDAADEVERLRAAVVERDTRLAETIRYHDARVNRADEATDAGRTAHAALVAELRALCDDSDHGWVHRLDLLALLDRHAPTLTTTED